MFIYVLPFPFFSSTWHSHINLCPGSPTGSYSTHHTSTTVNINQQINRTKEEIEKLKEEVGKLLEEKEKLMTQSENLKNQSSTLGNVSEKIDEILEASTNRIRANSDLPYTCTEFTNLLSTFTTALQNEDTDWVKLASDIISSIVGTCTLDEISDLQTVKADADDKISEKTELLSVEITNLQTEINDKIDKINEKQDIIEQLNEHLSNLMKSTTISTPTATISITETTNRNEENSYSPSFPTKEIKTSSTNDFPL